MKRSSLLFTLALPLLCFLLISTAHAGIVVFIGDQGTLVSVQDPAVVDPASALNELAAGPSAVWGASGLTSAIPAGTAIQRLEINGDAVTVDFSDRMLTGDFSEASMETAFKQVVWTLRQFNLGDNVRLMVNGRDLYSYLPPAPVITPKAQSEAMTMEAATAGSLTGRSITLSPGHGKFWNGTGWFTQRPVYCSPLSEEDYHNVDNAIYLAQYLTQDGMTVKLPRCIDKNFGASPYAGNDAWWHMASPYWLLYQGYPCTVYASSDGDCTLGTGVSESNNDIRARPLASDYDNTNIYISLHTNGSAGNCFGSLCPTGTDTYYDCSAEHASWCTVSQNLSNAVHPALITSIRNNVGDTGWVDRGQHDSIGNYGEIRIPDRAAILIELGFHDSCDLDAQKLRDPWWTSGAMWGVYKGVCDYFGVLPTWGFYSDEYVSDTIPASLAPGESRQVQITFRNRGVVWNEAHAIRLGTVGDSDPFTGTTRYTIAGDVAPGSTYTFTVTLTAPTTPGNYVTDWQMVRDGVTWFGATLTKTIQVGGTPDTEAPTVPTNLQATAVSSTQINLTWTASTDNVGVAGYKVFRNGSQIGSSGTTSYSDTTCSPNTTYTYTVSAYDGALNESAQSAPAQATTPAQTEFIIDNPAASFTGSWSTGTSSGDKYGSDYRYIGTQATETGTATYTPSIQLAGTYDVYCWYPQGTNRSTAAPHTVVWNGGQQTINVNQQANGGRWNLLVSAKPFAVGTGGYVRIGNATGETSLVVMADAVRFVKVGDVDTQAPTVPTNVQGTAVSGTQVNLTWTASTDNVGVAGYKIFRDGLQIGTSATTSYSDTTCQPNTTYAYTVSAYDAANNESAQSSPATSVTTLGDTTPPVISGVASTTGAGSATVTWTTNEASTTQVEYGLTTSYGSLTTLNPALVTSHSQGISGLARKTTYHYRVRSKDAANNEAISGDYTFRTK